MDYIRLAGERGQANFGWLDSKHSFSFGSYYDPRHMGFSVLRVINDDTVSPGAGFSPHGHQDMEIISYVLEGNIEHKDSTGNHYVIPAGEVQRMSAGTGITHSEYNPSETDSLKFLQIWLLPNVQGILPSYEQASIRQTGKLTALVTPDGQDGSLHIHQDAAIYRLVLEPGEEYQLETGSRFGYLHVINGAAITDRLTVKAGDAFGLKSDRQQHLRAGDQGVEALWFDLPAKAS
ncbi:pirin family protein [Gynuella sp.]|uniref:pirin family protein n=1 Tax=Gynuella sp. TaxID=2969146 RepID=UPI003D0991A4